MIGGDYGTGGFAGRDPRLWWMVLASATLHVVVVAALLMLPRGSTRLPMPLRSYTVDLVAPDRLGGTNMVPGGRGRVPAAPRVAALPAPPDTSARPASPAEPRPPAKAETQAEAAEKRPPAPKEPVAAEKAKERIEDQAKAHAVALPDKLEKPEPPVPLAKEKPEPKAAAKPEPAKPDAKQQKALQKAKDAAANKAADEKKAADTKKAADEKKAADAKKAADEKKAAEQKTAADAKRAADEKKAADAKKAADEKKAAEEKKAADAKVAADAKQVGAALAAGQVAAAQARDERIAAAIRRIEAQMGELGGGTGPNNGQPPGGPISVGPGEGVGGQPIGAAYILYRSLLEAKIKQNWAWAGTSQNLETTVHFKITENGEIVDIQILKSSGDASYDRSVERAVRGSSPLPSPPEEFREQFGDVEYVFTPKSLQM